MSLVSLNHCSSSSAVIANSCRISSYKHGHKTVSHGKFKVPIKMSNKICSTAEDLDQDLVSLSKTVSKRSFPIATFATAIAATNLLVTDAAHAVQMKDALGTFLRVKKGLLLFKRSLMEALEIGLEAF